MKLKELKFGDKFRFSLDINRGNTITYVYIGSNTEKRFFDEVPLAFNECGKSGFRNLPQRWWEEEVELVGASQKYIYSELQAQWVKEYNVKNGDVVRLVDGQPPYPNIEGGKKGRTDLDNVAGNLYTIRRVDVDCVVLEPEKGPGFYVPYWYAEVQDEAHKPYSFADAAELLGRKIVYGGTAAYLILKANAEYVSYHNGKADYKTLTWYTWLDGPDAGKPVGKLTYVPRPACK